MHIRYESIPFLRRSLLALCFLALLLACNSKPQRPDGNDASIQSAEDYIGTVQQGTVTEVMTAGKYTVACFRSGDLSYWLATNPTDLKIGDQVLLTNPQVMHDFYSPALDRQFPVILFVSEVTVARPSIFDQSRPDNLPSGHPMVDSSTSAKRPLAGSIARAKDSLTIGELYQHRKRLVGTRVRIAGKIVKVNTDIMGLNWIHLQDGTDFDGAYDLIVTSAERPLPGTIVTAEGVLVLGKTFRKGFHIPLLVQDASFTGSATPSH